MSKEVWNAHEDKKGKEYIDYYDKDPREDDHSSIHITFDIETGAMYRNVGKTINGKYYYFNADGVCTTGC